ncbi:Carcinoembryonic antigen-related cell adhesion molecule 20 Precursor [Channa argus]|uniref:Carcinoembryonic antigen-related cell adhesion molecule 20 n=1 Tax=Channa argus TaxID=215402 RepID=A0A6G1QQS6_CHAAH|nr:Carcinoembryonic antigen-related cell adhesion molecule 20 Precursor [Channa argus]
MVHCSVCVLLPLLICLAGFSASKTEQDGTMGDNSYGPSSVEITGVDVVTVGILYGFECLAECNPACQFTWTRGNETSKGQQMNLQLQHLMPTQILTCTAVNPATGRLVTVQKKLQVTEGPSNVQISGPPSLTFDAVSVFTCSADCYPSCSYSWTVIVEDQTISKTEGKTISVTPYDSTVASETLVCVAEDTVSHLYISSSLKRWVTSQTDVSIKGTTTVTMGKQYTFLCSATCIPYCNYTWNYMGKTLHGDLIQLPILHQGEKPRFVSYMEITVGDYSPLTCKAINAVSQATITATINLAIIDPFSVVPTSQALPVAGKLFSLECTGSQNPASITWLKDNEPISASKRVHFSPDHITMTFSPLLQKDGGLYQCVVAEGGTPIPSVPYQMQVNYGPNNVVISGPDSLEIGVKATFTCSAECFPSCSFTWTLYGKNITGSTIDITVNRHILKEFISCKAENTITGMTATVNETLSVSDPGWCGC